MDEIKPEHLVTKQECQEMIDKAIDKHNKTATIISAILGGILLAFWFDLFGFDLFGFDLVGFDLVGVDFGGWLVGSLLHGWLPAAVFLGHFLCSGKMPTVAGFQQVSGRAGYPATTVPTEIQQRDPTNKTGH